MTFREQEMPIDIGKTKNNYDKKERLKCFNYNKYGHMAKKCQKKRRRIQESALDAKE